MTRNLPLLESAARTADVNTDDISGGIGVKITIDVTSITATPSVVFTIQGKDSVSGKYYTILASAAITGTGTTVLTVYPGIAVTSNISSSDILPETWRVNCNHADTDSITYSLAADIIK